MAQLTTTDMALIDKIFGMYGGYVLDFSNDRFAAFFNRDLKIDIYHERYALHGSSKGKHFRAFLEVSPDTDVVRALSALWEYREAGRLDRGEEEDVPNARQRLSAVLQKLGGKPIPIDLDAEPGQPKVAPETKGPSRSDLVSLEQEFLALTAMNEAPQQRGFAFERFLKRWFDVWGLDAHASFRTVGESRAVKATSSPNRLKERPGPTACDLENAMSGRLAGQLMSTVDATTLINIFQPSSG